MYVCIYIDIHVLELYIYIDAYSHIVFEAGSGLPVAVAAAVSQA